MPTVHMLKGLPASGKTTLALEMVRDEHMKRVSKDDLRAMLHAGGYTPELEVFVITVRNAIIEYALTRGFDVVVDDTNLNPIHEEQLRLLAANFLAGFHVIQINTPLQECLERDRKRPHPIGDEVILKMYWEYINVNQTQEMP